MSVTILRFGSIYNLYLLCFTRRWEWFTSENLLPLNQQLVSSYKPAIDVSTVGLYVARQWDERSKTEEEALLSGTGVNGLVLSSFRLDNPKTVARGDWITVQISNIYNRNGISSLPDNPPILLLNAIILTSPVFIKWSGRIYVIIFIHDTQIQQQNL